MSEAGSRRLALALLLALAASFVVLHGQLARGARFVPDDLCQRANVVAYGALGSQRILYATWSGRWVSNGMVASAMTVLLMVASFASKEIINRWGCPYVVCQAAWASSGVS